MYRLIYVFFLVLTHGIFCADSGLSQFPTATQEVAPEENSLHLLIQAQEQSAKKFKLLLQYLREYQEMEAKAIQNPDNVDGLYKLSEKALEVHEIIRECHVEQYFRPQFLEDLDKVSQTALKRNLPLLSE